jgi:hypothetical protein
MDIMSISSAIESVLIASASTVALYLIGPRGAFGKARRTLTLAQTLPQPSDMSAQQVADKQFNESRSALLQPTR